MEIQLPVGLNSVYQPTIAVIGLGYVGLPVAIAMGRKFHVTGYDINIDRISELRSRKDRTYEVSVEDLSKFTGQWSYNYADLRGMDIYIVAVPTPITDKNEPDLGPLMSACETVGKAMAVGATVIFESTVYPGCTEEDCIPALEKASGFKHGKHFTVGYSPERINPGDKTHRFETIKKVVSACSPEALVKVSFIYTAAVQEAGIYQASSIKVAEAAKIIENTQRDVNVALINEVALICDRLGIDTKDVLDAAATKWNFLKFTPGLVGGHCIGVDPYYLIAKARALGYESKVIASGRSVNDGMGAFIAQKAVNEYESATVRPPVTGRIRAAILGFTFKENCSDIRNTKVVDIIRRLEEKGVDVSVSDPIASKEQAKKVYGLDLLQLSKVPKADIVIMAVAHDEYKKRALDTVDKVCKPGATLIDVKSIMNAKDARARGLHYARI